MALDPLSIIGVGLSAVGTLGSALGSMQSANAQAAQANYAAQVARNNQQIEQQNAEYAARAGEAQAQAEQMKGRATYGRALAGLAANNVDVNTGSAVDVLQTERETGLLNTENVRQNAALQGYGYRSQATNFGAEAGLESAKASQARTAGFMGAATSLLSGASNIGSKFGFWGTPTTPTTPTLALENTTPQKGLIY